MFIFLGQTATSLFSEGQEKSYRNKRTNNHYLVPIISKVRSEDCNSMYTFAIYKEGDMDHMRLIHADKYCRNERYQTEKRERHIKEEEKKTSVNWFGNFHNWVTKICRPLVKFYPHGG